MEKNVKFWSDELQRRMKRIGQPAIKKEPILTSLHAPLYKVVMRRDGFEHPIAWAIPTESEATIIIEHAKKKIAKAKGVNPDGADYFKLDPEFRIEKQ